MFKPVLDPYGTTHFCHGVVDVMECCWGSDTEGKSQAEQVFATWGWGYLFTQVMESYAWLIMYDVCKGFVFEEGAESEADGA